MPVRQDCLLKAVNKMEDSLFELPILVNRYYGASLRGPCILVKVEAMGEALVVIGASNGWGPFPLTAEQADQVLKELTAEMGRIEADVTTLRRRSESGAEKGMHFPIHVFPP